MFTNRTIFCALFVSFAVVFAFIAGQGTGLEKDPVSGNCLECLCDAITGCNTTVRCKDKVCGMFSITMPFWIDGGKPIPSGENVNAPDAYAKCANEPVCAAQTVINYMNRFAQDCNGDKKIDCYDYFAIHMLGGYGCNGGLGKDDSRYQRFDHCWKVLTNQPTETATPPPAPPQTEFSEESQQFGQQIGNHQSYEFTKHINKRIGEPET